VNSVTAHERAALSIAGRYTVHRATVEEFQESRISWNRLVSGMRFASPFCTWEWIFTWWECFGAKLELIPLFINDGAQLCGILPLFRHSGSAAAQWFKGDTLDYCGATELHPDHLDIICSPKDAPACVAAALDFIAAQLPAWTRTRFPMLAEDGDLFRALPLSRGKLRVAVRHAAVAPYIALTDSFEDYLIRLPKKDRYKIKSPRKKFLEEGKLRYSAFEFCEYEMALRKLFELHAMRADAKEITSTFGRPSVFEFHRTLLQRLDPNDVILRCLKDEAKIVAMLYGFRCGNRIFFYQFGYDPDWSLASPGYILVSEAIREAFRMGCTEFNFLHGDESYKHAFTREVRTLSDCYVYNDTFSGHVARVTFELRESIKAVVRRGSESR
jgi:CelD/BcsL family acetyltransferase involved in cellulose biosynthesis